jgi:hypothetical protein
MNETPPRSKKLLIIIISIAVSLLVVAGLAIWLVLADANKKALSAAEKYDKDIAAYVTKLAKAKTESDLTKTAESLPQLDTVKFGKYTEQYRVAQSKSGILGTYRDRLAALLKHYEATLDFDTKFRELDVVTEDLLTRESDAERAAEDKADATRNKLQAELSGLRFDKKLEDDSKEYKAKEKEILDAGLKASIDPLVAKYDARRKVLSEYKQKLGELKTDALTDQYKQGMLRATDKKIKLMDELIGKLRNAKTPGETRRLAESYDSIKYEDADLEYYDARWASEELVYGDPNGYANYIVGAMRYISEDAQVPTDKQEAKLYGEVIYYGHRSAWVVAGYKDKLTRAYQAKVRFNLNILRDIIGKSDVRKEIKDKYATLVSAAYDTVSVMPGDDAYGKTTAAGRLDNLLSFAEYLDNYVGVTYAHSVVDSKVSEAAMRAEAKAIRNYYGTLKSESLPKTLYGKAERDAFLKKMDTCMDYHFDYYDQWITNTLELKDIKPLDDNYASESGRLDAKLDKLAAGYNECYGEAGKLYETALRRAEAYQGYRELAIKQLEAIH